ncbi:MAG: protein up-regulated by thyroid hormone-putative PQQ-dependent glucose dehydrogenase [Ignavibacteria bacterium]|nr:MAG: protein up-regulated by thyroid hormone-putative PQQ-dependent glucose dehydrogenase [Ignavibacteria bacterium]KAF0161532.1 MAG: protein up-regulated by thyroid hormone-putative PQQ-dependent glucose dehydrogenase [Ignavibacteria bacterium]
MKYFVSIFVLFLALISCSNSSAQLTIEQAFPELTFQQPVDIQNAADGSNRLFIVEQRGIISVFENNQTVKTKKVFLDITDRVSSGGEMGLLGLAFHPNYNSNGYFYVNYTTNSPSRRTIISRFKVSTDPDLANKNSELILMQIAQPYSNHNGGQTSFGPDGFLYISLGDGGSGGDPQNYAQNLQSHLGKILRIDVDKTDLGINYSIPLDNPFRRNNLGYKEEIYAYGLRNVWRFSFDLITKDLWAADVGQNAWEEINIITKGGNFGWRCYEGTHSFNTSGCNAANYIPPVFEYPHNSEGGFSITGGFVYRGSKVPELYGKYVYADFVSGHIWALELKNGKAFNDRLFTKAHPVSTFGIDEKKELYFANYSSGKIYRFKTSGTKSGKASLPEKFELHQNYPNPFNPATAISYKLQGASHITLKVYDVLGREVATLVDEFQNAGIYNSQFSIPRLAEDARRGRKRVNSQLSSGVYFYRLTAGNPSAGLGRGFVETKKMTLMK